MLLGLLLLIFIIEDLTLLSWLLNETHFNYGIACNWFTFTNKQQTIISLVNLNNILYHYIVSSTAIES